MRIIAGSLRGREIRLPKNSRVRPATGFVREKLMSLYTPDRMASGAFLDICAGSGLIGYESLSRGAQHVYFIEVDAQTTQALKESAEHFAVADKITVLRCDARRCAQRLSKVVEQHGRISCAMLDAPYISGMAQDLLERLAAAIATGDLQDSFSADALLIVRTPDQLRSDLPGLRFIEARGCGGRDKLWIWAVETAAPPEG
ncbi:MAG: RsmD family RNA methyltransferase [bacterium]|nr:RsmD family RNA methyltransferase [bacterium]